MCICPYTDFSEAFEHCVNYVEFGGNAAAINETVTGYKIRKDIFVLPFDLDRFLGELHGYIYSAINNEKGRYLYFNTVNVSYGMSVYDRLINIFENILNEKHHSFISFKTLGDFVIHKEYLYDRLCYINEKYVLTPDCIQAINEYKDVVNLLHKAKALNLKYNIKEGIKAASISYNKLFIDKFIEILKNAKEKEQNILSAVYDTLKRSPILKTEQKDMLIPHDYTTSSDDKGICITLASPQLLERLVIISSENQRKSKKIILNNKDAFMVPENQYRLSDKYSFELSPQTTDSILIKNTDNSPIDLSKLDIRIYKLPAYIEYRHDLCRLFSCERTGGIHDDTVFNLIGNDPNITYDMKFNADIAKYIYLKYSVECDSQTAQFFFLNAEDDTLTENYSKTFTISPYDGKREYIIDMSDNPEWRGIIHMIRFDPVSYDNGNLR